MATLIANIGTSDLTVKIQGFEYYIPVGFDRDEPNEVAEDLTEDEKVIWERSSREDFVANGLCKELGVEVRGQGRNAYSFRELTEKLLAAYQREPDFWQERIRPGRIWGVIHTAIEEFSVKKINIFVTNQNPPQHQDTCFLFEIIKRWIERHLQREDILFLKRVIPQNVKPNQQDLVLNEYYRFFVDEIDSNEVVLVSTKGGTPQMQTALRLQSITADIPKLLFLDPVLSKQKVLRGEPSPCTRTSYWQYQRTQKYRVVMQLLERFDFAGACQVLKSWQSILSFQIEQGVVSKSQLHSSRKLVDDAIRGLQVADSLMNLDIEAARASKKEMNLDISLDLDTRINQAIGNHSILLNLYSQCKIYKQNQQISHFLSRMSSLCEEILDEVIEKLGGRQYLKSATVGSRVEIREIKRLLPQDQLGLLDSLDYFKDGEYAKILYRASKLSFLAILLAIRKNVGKNGACEDKSLSDLKEKIDSLEFWIRKRNEMIHDSQGFSSNRISELNKEAKQKGACPYEDILKVLADILISPLLKLPNIDKQRLITDDDLYLYTDLKTWARERLLRDLRSF
ncbi:hypothetical protein NW813_02480 [Synechococcus sp. R55.6]|uniref:hypothetical protein n=1 Tax=unclassified Synechococcus TaxID=2626047 RepID=UPI0039C172ED